MDIHKPGSIHGWRDFAKEVGIIVIGVLLAMAAEQVVETLRLRHQAAENEEAFRADLRADALNTIERIALRPCAAERIADLASSLAHDGRWAANPQPSAGKSDDARIELRDTFHTPNRNWLRSSWETAIHSDAIRLLSQERRTDYDSEFNQVRILDQAQAIQEAAEAELIPLSYDLQLTPQLRANFLAKLGVIQKQEQLIQIMSEQLLQSAVRLRATPRAADMKEVVEIQRKLRGACVQDVKLPSPNAR